MNWIRKMFEDANGVPDDARVAAFLMVLGYVTVALIAAIQNQPIDFQDLGIGAGALAAGIGGWFGFRKGN